MGIPYAHQLASSPQGVNDGPQPRFRQHGGGRRKDPPVSICPSDDSPQKAAMPTATNKTRFATLLNPLCLSAWSLLVLGAGRETDCALESLPRRLGRAPRLGREMGGYLFSVA